MYRYIFNSSMRAKEYDLVLQSCKENYSLLFDIENSLQTEPPFDDKALFLDHVSNARKVIEKLDIVTQGLKKKSEGNKYGFFEYRKETKQVNTAYDAFATSGAHLNQLTQKYSFN